MFTRKGATGMHHLDGNLGKGPVVYRFIHPRTAQTYDLSARSQGAQTSGTAAEETARGGFRFLLSVDPQVTIGFTTKMVRKNRKRNYR